MRSWSCNRIQFHPILENERVKLKEKLNSTNLIVIKIEVNILKKPVLHLNL